MDLAATAAAVIARARTNSGLTAAAFDYDIAVNYDTSLHGIGGMHSPLGGAAYEIANECVPAGATTDQRDANAAALWAALHENLVAYADRCRTRRYAGWSTAARSRGARIRYAA